MTSYLQPSLSELSAQEAEGSLVSSTGLKLGEATPTNHPDSKPLLTKSPNHLRRHSNVLLANIN